MKKNEFRELVDRDLSGLVWDERQSQKVRRALDEEEKTVKKKLSTGLVLVLALLVLGMAAALAAGLGLFGEMGQLDSNGMDPRVGDLENVSETVSQTVTTPEGVTVTIQQAYYDGSRVFISYKMSGALDALTLEKDVPDVAAWDEEQQGVRYGEYYFSEGPAWQQMAEYLDGSEPRYVVWYHVGMHDGLALQDGTYLDIIGGTSLEQEDGSIIGWKECEIPPEMAKDELAVKAMLFSGTQVIYQDQDGFKTQYTADADKTDVNFTVRRDNTAVKLTGSAGTDVYTAVAAMTLNPVDLKGTIALTCPESWLKDWREWDGSGGDLIESWSLYAGDTQIAEPLELGVSGDENPLVFDLCYQHGGTMEGLSLVPVYRETGAHLQEAIALVAQK